jgi:hypothetical protein
MARLSQNVTIFGTIRLKLPKIMANILYDYLFHYNSYAKEWNAFKREDKEKYFNGEITKNEVYRAKSFNTVLKYLKQKASNKADDLFYRESKSDSDESL